MKLDTTEIVTLPFAIYEQRIDYLQTIELIKAIMEFLNMLKVLMIGNFLYMNGKF